MTEKRKAPAWPARAAAWAAAVILTVTLTASVLGLTAVRVLTSEDLHVRTATEETIITGQMDKLSALIGDLAEDYAFSAETVTGALRREDFREYNEAAARWWTRIVTEGIMDEIPVWSAEKLVPLIQDTLNPAVYPEEDRAETAEEIRLIIEKAFNRTVMPVRKALVTLGVRYLKRKTDLPGAIRFATGLPQAGLAVSLLCAGLIALLLGSRIRLSLKYYGAALAGAGLSVATGIILVRTAGFDGIIRETSAGLDQQLTRMMGTIRLESWLAAGLLLAAGFICLILFTRRHGRLPADEGTNGGNHETEQNDTPDPVLRNTGEASNRRRGGSAQRAL